METAPSTAEIADILSAQRDYFQTHATRPLDFRLESLHKLRQAIRRYEDTFYDALKKDLGKAPFESYATEIGFVLEEISFHMRHLKKWTRPTRIRTDLVNFYSRSCILHEPYGLALIIAPWNYPLQLLLEPLVGAISAGNCAVVKPAHYSQHTTRAIMEMIAETFDPKYISVIPGDRRVMQALLEQRFDYIFFTGSPSLGKIVMGKAARHLTPVTLELGGKSPCIVEEDADVELAARRLVFGKFLNAGQSCLAPDYVLVHARVKNRLIEEIKNKLMAFYGSNPRNSPDYGRIITREQFARLVELIASGKVIFGGDTDERTRYIAPTLLDDVRDSDPVMQQEIFGPVLPIITYDRLEQAVALINGHEKPLALYFFTASRSKEKWLLARTSSGGCCINDTVVHLTNPRLPFGGVGHSGMGGYHGKHSFDTFSHHRAVLAKTTLFDLPLRYPPFRNKLRLVKRIMK